MQLHGLAKAYSLDALNDEGGVLNDTFAGEKLVVDYLPAVGKVALPKDWQKAVKSREHREIRNANDLTFEMVSTVLGKEPKLAKEMNAEFLLAMPTEDRLRVLTAFTSDAKRGATAPEGEIAPDLRNEVALRGLIGETRAYERGAHTFSRGAGPMELKDETGATWRVTETALEGPHGEKLPRLSGHLAYWFGWYAFFPKTELYAGPMSGRENRQMRPKAQAEP
jgi:hypothetical protein